MRRLSMMTILPLAVFFFCVSLASAQMITSTLYGTVTDPSGAAIPGATIKATSDDTGTSSTTATNATGEFTLRSLQPGRYTIQVEAQGFKSQKQSGLQVPEAVRASACSRRPATRDLRPGSRRRVHDGGDFGCRAAPQFGLCRAEIEPG